MDIAGIVANVSGNTTIRNCTSSIYLLSTRSADVDAGGIVAHVNDNQTVNVIGCSFTGRITYTNEKGNEGGGIVGWLRAGATANVTGCVFAPTTILISNWDLPFKMFVCGATGSTTNINNCYYNDVAAAQSEITRQGKQMRRITQASNVSKSISGEGTKYNADYITCYSTGIHYHYWDYAGAGEEVPLTVTHFTPPEGYVWRNYTVTGGGTLTAQTETSATLLMSDADQEIGLEWRPLPEVTWDPTDAEKSNWTISLVTAGAAVTATYGGSKHVKSVTYRPVPTIGGKFTINASGDKVYFAKGNLRYVSGTWSFFDHQYDFYNTYSADAWDKFGWSTSSTTYGMSTSQDYGDYSGDFVDWGTVTGIGEGWYTLSKDEWTYLLTTRSASTVNGTANARYAKAYLFGTTHGIIIFPDVYTHPAGVAAPTGINATNSTSWSGNQYNATDWSKMEAAGCVFLPAAGYRNGVTVTDVGNCGYYWSSTAYDGDNANFMYFGSDGLGAGLLSYRKFGRSVRLVFPAE
jgi:hypothetical protein